MPENDQNYEKQTHIEIIMIAFGVDEMEARFMLAIDSGEIDGDVICIDDDSDLETEGDSSTSTSSAG